MLVKELIQNLNEVDGAEIFSGTFHPLSKNVPLVIFHTDDEYVEIFADDGTIPLPEYLPKDIPLTNSEAIEELKTKHQDLPIILTLGNEEDDSISSMGGVQWKNGQLYLDTENCPIQV